MGLYRLFEKLGARLGCPYHLTEPAVTGISHPSIQVFRRFRVSLFHSLYRRWWVGLAVDGMVLTSPSFLRCIHT
jgi:hypothetical protein